MSRSRRKRNRRHWAKKDKPQEPVCNCNAEKYKNVHTMNCPAKEKAECTCNSSAYNGAHIASCPASYSNTKYTGGSYSYKTSDWSSNYCTKAHWRTPVLLGSDLIVYASAWSDRPKTQWSGDTDIEPDYGFYLDDLWTGNRMTVSPGLDLPIVGMKPQIIHFPCTDQQAPPDLDAFKAMIEWILEQIALGKLVDIGCIGGHGRTGLTLSCLLVAQGMDPWDAIEKIRKDYCEEAVETWTQEKFVGKMWSAFHEGEEPRESPLKAQPKTTTWTGGTSEPIMDKCPNCTNAVYYLDTHRQMCAGHPTDEELEEAVKAATGDKRNAIQKAWDNVPRHPKKGGWDSHPCPREDCTYDRVYDQTIHDKAVHGIIDGEVVDEIDQAVREHYEDMPAMSQDEEEYQTWLRLNAQELKKQGLIDTIEGELVASVDGEEWDKRMSQMDEACPFGECQYPFECEPEEGQCWRKLVSGGEVT